MAREKHYDVFISQAEAAATKLAKRKAWLKANAWAVLSAGLALFAMAAWWVSRTWPSVPPEDDAAATELEERAEAIPPSGGLATPPVETGENFSPPEAGESEPSAKPAAPPKGKTERAKTAESAKTGPSKKTGKEGADGSAAAKELAKLSPKMREWAEADFRASLKKRAQWPTNAARDPVVAQIVKDYENAAAEGRKLHRLGMHPKELVDKRPDLVLKFADLRSKVRGDIRQLIKDNKHEEALRYYNSAKYAFERLGMCPLGRPSFSN